MKKLLPILLCFPFISFAQTFVSTIAENKNVVLEEFTGISCTYCPDGHRIAKDIYNQNPNDVVLINIHTGSFATPQGLGTDFRTSFGSAIDAQANVSGYPAGTVNRHQFSMTQNGGTAMSRGDWTSASSQILTEPSYINIEAQASIDVSTRLLTVVVEAYYTGNAPAGILNNVNVALLQNNVEGPQTGGSQFNPSAILPNGNYNHQHMLRHLVTGQWGETIMNPSGFWTNTYTYNIPNDLNSVVYDLFNLEVAVFVAEGQQEIINGNLASLSFITPPVTFVSTVPENRNVILEEFTGIHCPSCPGGHSQSQGLYDNNPGDVFVINIHTGSLAAPNPGEPDYRVDPTGNNLMWATVPGATGIGFPCGTINRHEYLFTSAPTPQQGPGTFAYSQSDWPVLVSQVLNEPSPVNVGVQANIDANNNLVVDVEVYYTGSQTVNSNYLHVAVLQNDIVENPMVQAGGSSNSLWYDAATGTYTQQHMLRHMMTGTWGVPINTVTVGSLYSNQFNWSMPADINGVALNPTDIAIVAFVSEGQQDIITGTKALATISNNTSNSITVSSCDTYTWPVNGQTYNSSGTYTDVSINAFGGIHTEILNLTINNSTSNSITVSSCDTYTWSENGQTYNTSGTYTYTGTNQFGCLHTATLYLTINHSTSNSFTVSSCDSYTWPVNGQTYNSSGTYSDVSTNASGCDHIEILYLTIDNSTSNINSVSSCDTYTWSVNGQTYNSSGTYSDVSTNAFGCDHTEILNLSINYSPNTTNILGLTSVNYLQVETYSVGQNLNSTFTWHLANGGIILNGINTNSVEVQWGNNSGIFELYLVEVSIDGCADTVFIDVNVGNSTSVQEHNVKKELLKITDLLGRESKGNKNQPLFYIYDDGTVEKKITID